MKLFYLCLFIVSFFANSLAFGENFGGLLFKDQCPIQLYNSRDSSFIGSKIYANSKTFHPLLKTLSNYAEKCHVKLNIKQSFTKENFLRNNFMLLNDRALLALQLGEGIQFELYSNKKRLLCNQSCLKQSLSSPIRSRRVKCFLKEVSRDSNFQRNHHNPAILIKRTISSASLITLRDQQKQLQNKCRNFKMI